MAPVSRFFQASFSNTLLRSAALAIALLVQASPAQAAPLTLNCESTTDNNARQFRIDFDNQTVQEVNVSPEKNPPGRAEISETSIYWKTITKLGAEEWQVTGSIDRLAGSIRWEVSNPNNPMQFQVLSGKCREATKPKF